MGDAVEGLGDAAADPPVLRVVFVADGDAVGALRGAVDVLGLECDVWERRVQRDTLALICRRAPGTKEE